MQIRKTTPSDKDDVWRLFQKILTAGDTYMLLPDTGRKQALTYWMNHENHCYIYQNNGCILGSYIIKDNKPGLGSHVANASFIVDKSAQGQGIGTRIGKHALVQAKKLGYHAMQFNAVVATNVAAIALWKKLGFVIVGTIPQAFSHRQYGLTAIHIMYRKL